MEKERQQLATERKRLEEMAKKAKEEAERIAREEAARKAREVAEQAKAKPQRLAALTRPTAIPSTNVKKFPFEILRGVWKGIRQCPRSRQDFQQYVENGNFSGNAANVRFEFDHESTFTNSHLSYDGTFNESTGRLQLKHAYLEIDAYIKIDPLRIEGRTDGGHCDFIKLEKQ